MSPKKPTPRPPKKVHVPAFDMLGVGGLLGSTHRVQPDPLRQLENEESAEQRKMINNLRHEELILRRENRIDREMQKQNLLRGKNENDPLDGYKKVVEIQNLMNAKKEDDLGDQLGRAIIPAIIQGILAPAPDPVDQMVKFKQASEMFNSNRPGGTSNEIDLKIEQLRGERELASKKMDLENRKFLMEYEQKQNMLNTLVNIGDTALKAFSGPIQQKMNELGQVSARHSVAGTQQTILGQTPNPDLESSKILIKCSCGFSDFMYFHGPPPNLIQCPECAQELRTGTLDELNVSDIRAELDEGDQKFVA